MAKSPKHRDPAKHSKKDPAKPTRAKASRPDVPAIDPSLADILNPAIGKGRAGLGAQTGIEARKRDEPEPSPHSPSKTGVNALLPGEGREGGGGAENSSPSPDPSRPPPLTPPHKGEGNPAASSSRRTIRGIAAPISPTRIAPGNQRRERLKASRNARRAATPPRGQVRNPPASTRNLPMISVTMRSTRQNP